MHVTVQFCYCALESDCSSSPLICHSIPLTTGAIPEGGPTQKTFFFLLFLVEEGRENPYTTISGPSSACQQNAI